MKLYVCHRKKTPATDKHLSLDRGQVCVNPLIETYALTVIHKVIENT